MYTLVHPCFLVYLTRQCCGDGVLGNADDLLYTNLVPSSFQQHTTILLILLMLEDLEGMHCCLLDSLTFCSLRNRMQCVKVGIYFGLETDMCHVKSHLHNRCASAYYGNPICALRILHPGT